MNHRVLDNPCRSRSTMVLHTVNFFTACASSCNWSSGLSRVVLGAVKPHDRRYSSPRNKLSDREPFFGSALRSRWTVPSCCSWSWSSCSSSKGIQHARAAIGLLPLAVQTEDDQIPPYSTTLQYLLPPPEPSRYADEAHSIITNIASSWGMKPNPLMDIYKTTGIGCAICFHPSTASVDRLAALSLYYWILYILDEACFDISDSRLLAMAEEFGIDTTMQHDRSRMGRFWKRLGNIFTLTELPSESVPIETAVCDTGRLMRSLDDSETWFDSFVETVEMYASASFEFHFHGGTEVTSHEELEEYIETRVANSGAYFVCSAIELANGKFLSVEARNHPQIQRLRYLCCRFTTFQNDLCSYHKELIGTFGEKETADRNTIQAMRNLDSLSVAQGLQRLMDMMVADSYEFLQLEQDPRVAELTAVDEGLRAYILGLKELMSGNSEFHLKSGRYLTVDNPFPEMRL